MHSMAQIKKSKKQNGNQSQSPSMALLSTGGCHQLPFSHGRTHQRQRPPPSLIFGRYTDFQEQHRRNTYSRHRLRYFSQARRVFFQVDSSPPQGTTSASFLGGAATSSLGFSKAAPKPNVPFRSLYRVASNPKNLNGLPLRPNINRTHTHAN